VNVGDQVNPWLLRRLFGLEAVLPQSRAQPHLLAVGSIMVFANKYSRIWGTGIMQPGDRIGDIVPGNVHAVRGKLTHERLRQLGMPIGDVPLGDPAFLAARAFAEGGSHEKRFRCGIAAHYVDRGHAWVQEALRDSDFADLNVHLPVSEFLERMISCEAVISSSLHGLIFAEALGIPNVWVEFSDRVAGGGFKFRDWFSLAEQPQAAPGRPTEPAEAIARRARLHDIGIDVNALTSAFPGALLAN
jgi:pyruvyltransferase